MKSKGKNFRYSGKSSGSNAKFAKTSNDEVMLPSSKAYSKAIASKEKYIKLAQEARSAGDRVSEQTYLQFSDHYSRIVMAAHENVDRVMDKPQEAKSQETSRVYPSDYWNKATNNTENVAEESVMEYELEEELVSG